ncbi:hypothetical protein DL98DRAFT_518068 [Cadophora sp. DSE1049]|nr:hypothetical protein DL98DRAFT_518068 [Cadophora sp. DSE1049]
MTISFWSVLVNLLFLGFELELGAVGGGSGTRYRTICKDADMAEGNGCRFRIMLFAMCNRMTEMVEDNGLG